MISQIWLQQFCCTIKTKHTNAKYTEGLFHPGMVHRDTFHNSQKCMLIILTDRREHNSSSFCQERGCAVVTLPGITQELCKNQVWYHNRRKFFHFQRMILHFQRTLDEDCTMYYKYPWNSSRRPKTSQGYSLCCFAMVKDSAALCTQLVQSPKELNWCDQTNRFNKRKSTEQWLKSPNTTVSKASLKLAELTFIEELDKDKIQ